MFNQVTIKAVDKVKVHGHCVQKVYFIDKKGTQFSTIVTLDTVLPSVGEKISRSRLHRAFYKLVSNIA